MNYTSRFLLSICLTIYCLLPGSIYASAFPAGHTFRNLSFPFDANLVQAFYQDEQGMMWIGTRKGLFSYDGSLLRLHMDRPDETDKCSIQAMVELEHNILCIGTDAGISWFDIEKEQFIAPPLTLLKLNAVRSLTLFKEELWIGSRDEGVWVYNPANDGLRRVELDRGQEGIIFALEQAGDKLFIGSYGGLSCYDATTGKRKKMAMEGDTNGPVCSLCWDSHQNQLWVGTENRLYRYSIADEKWVAFPWLQRNVFNALCMDAAGSLLMGTEHGVFLQDSQHLDQEPEHFTHDIRSEQSLRNNVVGSIFCDRDGNIWLGTERGVSIKQEESSSHLIPLSELQSGSEGNLFSCMLTDSQGDYWMGGENGLIHQKRSGECHWYRQNDKRHPLRLNRIRCIYEDKDHLIWIATDKSIARFNRDTEQFIYYQLTDRHRQLNANWAYDILEDAHHRLWIATYHGGLFIVDKRELLDGKPEQPFEALNNADVASLQVLGNTIYQLEEGDGQCIYASTRHGLACIHPDGMQATLYPCYPESMQFLNHALWYNVRGTLYRLETGALQPAVYPLEDEIHQIYAYASEGESLWLSSTAGISCLSLSSGEYRRVYPSDRYFRTIVFDAQNSQMLCGGEDCLLSLPVRPGKRPSVRRLFVSAVSSGGRDLEEICPSIYAEGTPRFTGQLHLPRAGEELCLFLSSFSYASDKEQYYYRLNNHSSWSALPQGENRLRFAGLSGGTYRLELAAAHPGHLPDAPISIYTIHIPYPWYATPWAIAFYIIFVLLLLSVTIRQIHRHSKRKYEKREREKSLELSKLKMDFFVNISHELKTPLSLIIAPLSKLISENRNGPLRHSLESIYQNSLRLNTLIYKILDFKQMEYESENTLLRSHVDLCILLRNNIHTFENALQEKGIVLEYTANVESLWLNLDRLKIESCLINILSNAIKYVPVPGGRIEVRLQKKGDVVHIVISDNGKGINEQELPFVFIRFFQGQHDKPDGDTGSGIGLYLVKKFIEMHHGTVEARNKRGLVVTLSLPLKGENLPVASHELPPEPETNAPDDAGRQTLLIIDDNQEMVDFLMEAFSADYQCQKAYNGQEGLLLVEEKTPDLIIVDEMMPVMDGMSFCRTIRRNQTSADIPLIMLTAKDDNDTELDSIRAGVDIFVSKPFDLRKLRLRMAQLLQKRSSLEKSLRIEAITQPEFKQESNRLTPDEELMERITKTIEEHMEQEKFTVTELAGLVAVDPKQLYRKVKQLTGMTPVNYMRKLRMKKAALLLAQRKFTVSEVMYLVGYTSASHFARCFSAEYGKSPKLYMEEAPE